MLFALLNAPPCLRHRYEDEINKRNNLENDFVILKKVNAHTHTKSYSFIDPRCGE